MIRVLIITGILPISEIKKKENENDILFVTEDMMLNKFSSISFHYIFTIPRAFKWLAYLSSKWKSYYLLRMKKTQHVRGRNISILGLLIPPRKFSLRRFLYELSFSLSRQQIDDIICHFQPTVIHAHNVDSDAFIARKISLKYNLPYVITARGLNAVSDHLVKVNLDGAKCIIALSPVQYNKVKSLTNSQVNIIPHGVSELFFKTKRKYEGSTTLVRIVSVCRLLKSKNLDLVIRSLSNIGSNFVYHIYGDGPDRDRLERLVHELKLGDRVFLKGFIDHVDLPSTLPNYDFFVMPSFPESLGRVYFEAMACGLPVIASKDTGIDGIITHGKEGFLVNHRDSKSLENALSQYLDNKELVIEAGINASALAATYSWDKILSDLYSLYEKSSST